MRRVSIQRPRVLPATIAVMALLMVVKSAALVIEALGGGRVATGETLVSQAIAAPAATGAGEAAAAQHPSEAPGAGGAERAGAGTGGAGTGGAGTGGTPQAGAHGGTAGADDAQTSAASPNTAPSPPVSEAERALLLDLRHRRASLDERARELDQRNAVLGAAEGKLSARVGELGALQARLEQLEAARRAHDDANWSGLVHVYETMKPREAAQIFDSLDMQVLLGVLDRMQPRRVAPILAAMQPDRARLATQMLAEMRTHAVTLPASAAGLAASPKG